MTTCNHGNDVALICYGIPVDNPANGKDTFIQIGVLSENGKGVLCKQFF